MNRGSWEKGTAGRGKHQPKTPKRKTPDAPPVGKAAQGFFHHLGHKLGRVEAALTDHYQTTAEIAHHALVSKKLARYALEQLAEEGKAERHTKVIPASDFSNTDWTYVWRRPQ